jgi:four helix bundle protein
MAKRSSKAMVALPAKQMTNRAGSRNTVAKEGLGKLVKDFTDLDAWKLARELRKMVYDLTKSFPVEEKHVLVAQLRRAALSVTANIAEGFGRYSYQENVQYCRHARGSAYEVRDHLSTALDANYLTQKEWREADELAQRVIQVLNGYIRSTQVRQKSKEGK